MWGSDVASWVEFCPVPSGCGGDSMTDGWMDRRMDGGVHNIPIAFLKKHGDNNFCTVISY